MSKNKKKTNKFRINWVKDSLEKIENKIQSGIDRVRYILKEGGENDEYLFFVSDIEDILGSGLVSILDSGIFKQQVFYGGNSQLRRLIASPDFWNIVNKDVLIIVDDSGQEPPTTTNKVEEDVQIPTSLGPIVRIGFKGNTKPFEEIKVAISPLDNISTVVGIPATLDEIRKLIRPITSVALDSRIKRIKELAADYTRGLINKENISDEDLAATDRYAFREPYRILYTEFERLFANDPVVQQFIENRKANNPDESYLKQVLAIGKIDQLLNVALALFSTVNA